jgi:hypothetical protein
MSDTTRPVLSITAADFEWECSRGTGAGGQKRNKTSSKVRCIHRPSGAEATDDTTRSQHQNRRNAWRRVIESPAFKTWLRLELARRAGRTAAAEAYVARELATPSRLRVEGKDSAGRWTPINQPLQDLEADPQTPDAPDGADGLPF